MIKLKNDMGKDSGSREGWRIYLGVSNILFLCLGFRHTDVLLVSMVRPNIHA